MRKQDLHWILPLLVAVENGKMLQVKFVSTQSGGVQVVEWKDCLNIEGLTFTLGKDYYRVKPVVPEYRAYSSPQEAGLAMAVRNLPSHDWTPHEHNVAMEGFVWLTDWQPIPEDWLKLLASQPV